MWKYVSRRIRDSVEKTYHHRTWTCGEKVPTSANGNASAPVVSTGTNDNDGRVDAQNAVQLHERKPDGVYSYCFTKNRWHGSSSSSSGQDDFKQNYGNTGNCNYQQTFLGALTWSSAIVCGWYTSQIICMKRRHCHHNRDGRRRGRCGRSKKAAEYIEKNEHSFRSVVMGHWGLAVNAEHKPKSNSFANLWFRHAFAELEEPSLHNINNDAKWQSTNSNHKAGDKLTSVNNENEPQKQSGNQKTVDDAVQDLLKVIGDIEFQLGLQHVEAEQFSIAASHFKLGTSHHHVGATFNLGICYELGLGVERNLKMALECYRVASAMGHAKAMYNVGIFHVHGLGGLPKNRKAARHYFMAAAKLGQIDAQKALGMVPQQKHQENDDPYGSVAEKGVTPNPYMPQSSFFKAVALA